MEEQDSFSPNIDQLQEEMINAYLRGRLPRYVYLLQTLASTFLEATNFPMSYNTQAVTDLFRQDELSTPQILELDLRLEQMAKDYASAKLSFINGHWGCSSEGKF